VVVDVVRHHAIHLLSPLVVVARHHSIHLLSPQVVLVPPLLVVLVEDHLHTLLLMVRLHQNIQAHCPFITLVNLDLNVLLHHHQRRTSHAIDHLYHVYHVLLSAAFDLGIHGF